MGKLHDEGMGLLGIAQSAQIQYEVRVDRVIYENEQRTLAREEKIRIFVENGGDYPDGYYDPDDEDDEDLPGKPVKSSKKALGCFTDAAKLGHPDSCYQLGMMIHNGEGGRNANTNGSGAAVVQTPRYRRDYCVKEGQAFDNKLGQSRWFKSEDYTLVDTWRKPCKDYRNFAPETARPCFCSLCPFVGKELPRVEHERRCSLQHEREYRLCVECGGRPPHGCDPCPPTAAEMALEGSLVTISVHGYFLPVMILAGASCTLQHILNRFCEHAGLYPFIRENSGLSFSIGGQPLDPGQTLSELGIGGDAALYFVYVEPVEEGTDAGEEFGTTAYWFAEAVRKDHAGAQYGLSSCHIQRYFVAQYRLGRGLFHAWPDCSILFHDASLPPTVPRLLRSAVSWLEKSAMQGHSLAQCALADMHHPNCPISYQIFGPRPYSPCDPMSFRTWSVPGYNGDYVSLKCRVDEFQAYFGIKKSYTSAVIWYQRSADQGGAQARYPQYRLAELCCAGNNFDEARAWLCKADECWPETLSTETDGCIDIPLISNKRRPINYRESFRGLLRRVNELELDYKKRGGMQNESTHERSEKDFHDDFQKCFKSGQRSSF